MSRILLLLCICFVWACQEAPKLEPKQGRIYLRLGTNQLKNGQYPIALKNLLMAEKIIPQNPVVQNNLGLAYYVRDKFKLAESHLRKAVELDPKYTEARNNLGRILIQNKKYDEALSQLQIAADDLTFNKPENSYSNLGIAYFYKKKFKSAFKFLKKSLKIRRDHCQTYSYYGRSLYELNRFQLAADALSNAVSKCPKEEADPAKFYNAMSQIKLKNVPEAKALFLEISKLSENDDYNRRAKKMLTLLNETEEK